MATVEHEGYQIVHQGNYALYNIKNIGSGPTPKPLRGGFNSVLLAKGAIEGYLRNKNKGKVDGKSDPTDKG